MKIPTSSKTPLVPLLTAVGFLGIETVFSRVQKANLRLFQDEIVLITGGSRGLGLILARLFLTEGATVIICARNDLELEKAKNQLKVFGKRIRTMRCDVSHRQEVEELVRNVVEKYGRLDVLVNNASIIQVGPAQVM